MLLLCTLLSCQKFEQGYTRMPGGIIQAKVIP